MPQLRYFARSPRYRSWRVDTKGGAKLDVSLTPVELATLREHGHAVFRSKLILKAQPPITAEQLAEVERRVGAPVPYCLRGTDGWRRLR